MEAAILDTDILSEIIKGKDRVVIERASDYRARHAVFTLTTLTVLEIVKGFAKKRREDRLQEFLRFIEFENVLSVSIDAAVLAGRIYARLEETGQTIGRIDPLIAAVALAENLPLVTGNTEHYLRIANLGFGLRLLNWRLPVAES